MRKINLLALKNATLLFSVLQEPRRHRAISIGPRIAIENTVVGEERYYLRKGAVVAIANRAPHFDLRSLERDSG